MSRPPFNPQPANPSAAASSVSIASISPQPAADNPDPVTGAAGAHPFGTGAGAAGAGIAGAAIGALGGPIGAALGAVVGAVAGGLAGKAMAETVNPTAEEAYWRENHADRPYAGADADFTDFRPAYQTGWEARSRYPGAEQFDELDEALKQEWEVRRGHSKLDWSRARPAARDAWDRVEQVYPRQTP